MSPASVATSSRRAPGLRAAVGVIALAVGLSGMPALASPSVPSSPLGVRLSAADLSESDVALIMGPSMMPTPSERFAETVDDLFLAPHGFNGALEVLTTPESPYYLDTSMTEGAQILTAKVQSLIADGDAGVDNPVTVFGYSQSAALTSLAMQQLHDAGVDSDAVRFVLIGDAANPNGGMLVGWDDVPGIVAPPGITLGNATPNDLYPTDIYTMEYDGYADFPRYPLNLLSTVNAMMGTVTQHLAYLGLTPEQIASATLLESSPGSLVDSYMIDSEYLPLLWPLLFVPVLGKPLYDLMEPDMRILVNLGYGNLDHGWNDGPADLPMQVSLAPPPIDADDLTAALTKGTQEGWDAFTADLMNPQTYQVPTLADSPVMETLLAAATNAGFVDSDDPTVPELLRGLTDMIWASLIGDAMASG